jgi:hypothetical protein
LKFLTNMFVGPDAIVEHIMQATAGIAWQQQLLNSHQVAVETDRATATCSLDATQVARSEATRTEHRELTFGDSRTADRRGVEQAAQTGLSEAARSKKPWQPRRVQWLSLSGRTNRCMSTA